MNLHFFFVCEREFLDRFESKLFDRAPSKENRALLYYVDSISRRRVFYAQIHVRQELYTQLLVVKMRLFFFSL